MWCVMIHRCLPENLQIILRCYFLRLLLIMWTPQKSCLRHIFYPSSSTKNQPLCGPFFQSCGILRWNRVFIFSCLFFHCFCFPGNQMICDHILHIFCMCPWRTWPCIVLFLYHLVLEHSIIAHVFLVSWFRLNLFSITNGFISWVPCMPFTKCWHFKIFSQVCIILVRLLNRHLY